MKECQAQAIIGPPQLSGEHSGREDESKNAMIWHFLSPHALQQVLPHMVVGMNLLIFISSHIFTHQ